MTCENAEGPAPCAGGAVAFTGAYLIADIVGSSRIGASLAEEGGRRGADRLCRLMTTTFSPLMAAVEGSGGVVAEVSGDSLHASWRHDGGDPAAFVARIGAVANAMLAGLDSRRVDGGEPVRARIGLGVGRIEADPAPGDLAARIVNGEAVRRAVEALARARPGGIAINRGVGEAEAEGDGLARPAAAPMVTRRPAGAGDLADPDPDGETRVLTAMAVELIGPEEALRAPRARVVGALRVADRALRGLADHVDQAHLDDKGLGFIALFGASDAAGAHARNDLFEGLAALRAAAAPLGLKVRIGVATGRVFVGRVVWGGAARNLLYGMPLVVSTRLMEAAQGETLADAETAAFARRARRPLSPPRLLAIKGAREPVTAHALPETGPVAEAAAAPPPLLGRTRETAAIAALLARAADRRALTFAGAPGMGKSALIAFAAHAAGATPVVALAPGAARSGAPLSAWRPALLAAAAEAGASPAAALTLDGATDLLVRRWAGAEPVLLLDDAHWLDEASTLLIRRLWRALPGLRLVVAYDPFAPSGPEPWLRTLFLGAADRFVLTGLDPADMRALLADRLGLAEIDDAELGLLHALCGGAPEAILDLGAYLGAEFARHARSSAARAMRPRLHEIELPLDMTQMIERRIGALSPEGRRVIKAASVAGRALDRALLLRLQVGGAAEVDAALAEAAAVGLIAPGPDGRLRFRTESIWNVAYGMIAESLAVELHARIAAAVEADPDAPVDQRAAALAYHWTRAHDPARAVRHLCRAARLSADGGAHGAALRDFEQALQFAAQARAAGAPPLAGAWREAAWCWRAAEASTALGDLERGLGLCLRGLALLGGPPGPAGWGWTLRAALAAPRLAGRALAPRLFGAVAPRFAERMRRRTIGRLLVLASECLYFRSDVAGMLSASALAVDAFETAGARAEAARPCALLGYAAGVSGAGGLSRSLFARAQPDCAREQHLEGLNFLAGGRALVAFARGDLDAALAAAHAALALAERRGAQHPLGMGRTLVGLMLHQAGRFAEAEAQFAVLGVEARRAANDQHLAWSLYATAAALMPRGDLDRAAALLHEAGRLSALVGDDLSALNLCALRAQCAAAQGDLDAAAAHARETLARTLATPPSNWGSFEGFLGAGEALLAVALRAGDKAGRAACLADAARATARAARFVRVFRFAAPRLAQHRAVLAALAGDAGGAQRALARALADARRGGAAHEVARALALRAALAPGGPDRGMLAEAEAAAARCGAGLGALAGAALDCAPSLATGRIP